MQTCETEFQSTGTLLHWYLIGRFSRLFLQGPSSGDEHDDVHGVTGQLLLDDGDGVAGGHALNHVAALQDNADVYYEMLY